MEKSKGRGQLVRSMLRRNQENQKSSRTLEEEAAGVSEFGTNVQEENDKDSNHDHGQFEDFEASVDEPPPKIRDFGINEEQDITAIERLQLELWESNPCQNGDDYLDFGLRKCDSGHYFPAELGVCDECGGFSGEVDDKVPGPVEDAESLAEFGLLRCINAHVYPKMFHICNICGMRTPEWYSSEIDSRLSDFPILGFSKTSTAGTSSSIHKFSKAQKAQWNLAQEINDRKQSTGTEKIETRSLHTHNRPNSLTWTSGEDELPFSGKKTRPPKTG